MKSIKRSMRGNQALLWFPVDITREGASAFTLRKV